VAIFGLVVYLISFIPVIRQITRLADPYFVTNDRADLANQPASGWDQHEPIPIKKA
jgi:hypothetical protein